MWWHSKSSVSWQYSSSNTEQAEKWQPINYEYDIKPLCIERVNSSNCSSNFNRQPNQSLKFKSWSNWNKKTEDCLSDLVCFNCTNIFTAAKSPSSTCNTQAHHSSQFVVKKNYFPNRFRSDSSNFHHKVTRAKGSPTNTAVQDTFANR